MTTEAGRDHLQHMTLILRNDAGYFRQCDIDQHQPQGIPYMRYYNLLLVACRLPAYGNTSMADV